MMSSAIPRTGWLVAKKTIPITTAISATSPLSRASWRDERDGMATPYERQTPAGRDNVSAWRSGRALLRSGQLCWLLRPLDLDLLRRRRLRSRHPHPHSKDSVLVRRGHLFLGHTFRQRDATGEAAVAKLAAVVTLRFLFRLPSALHSNMKDAIPHRDLHVLVRIDSRQLGPHDRCSAVSSIRSGRSSVSGSGR